MQELAKYLELELSMVHPDGAPKAGHDTPHRSIGI